MRTAFLALLLSASAVPAAAESLQSAIAAAYENNPELQAQRAVVRQVDEQLPQALAPARPQVGIQMSADQAGLNDFQDNGRTYQAAIQLIQSLYRGGRTEAATDAAENRILAARARLRSLENQIILNTVTAYVDTLRFAEVVRLNENLAKILERELQQSRDRFEVGDITRTDVAQSEARLANARANVQNARVNLVSAQQAFQRLVGRPAVDLEPLPPTPMLPGTAGQALDLARQNDPDLIAARFDEAAARHDVEAVERGRRPSVDLTVRSAYLKFEGGGGGANFVRQGQFVAQDAILSATVPLYQRGLIGSQIRQAQQARSQAAANITTTDRQTQEQVTNSWEQLLAARAVIDASRVAVDANALAAEGSRQENLVGTRTFIEVLNAEQELLNTQVNLVTARRNEQVAAYSLLASLGAAEAVALGVPVQEYDAVSNARRVRRHAGDYGDANPPALPRPSEASATRSLVIGPPVP